MLTIYGRKPALEAMRSSDTRIFRLHLADSNKPASILEELIQIAENQQAEVVYHSRQALSRISKNSKQDQGVAVDIQLKGFQLFHDWIKQYNHDKTHTIIALDGVTNPQNLGMIIRSVCASPASALMIPETGCAKLDSLVIKASAGTLFKANIIRSNNLLANLSELKSKKFDLVGLDVNSPITISEYDQGNSAVYVLGNETEGLSQDVQALCNVKVKIPMQNNVESLNVAVTAGIIAFKGSI